MLYHSVTGSLGWPGGDTVTAILCGADLVFYYFFSQSWKQITVTPTGITARNVVFNKQTTINYADITGISTYRESRPGRGGGYFGRDFVIEFNHNQTISFNESWYDNYDKLTMAIYLHKFGPGHGRERYLERHGIMK